MRLSLNSLLYCQQDAPEWLMPWLVEEGPITPKLQAISGEARLNVLQQDWRPAQWWEQQALDCRPEQTVFCRDITIMSHDSLAWFARSLIPDQCYALQPEFFDQLDRVSMASLIFNEPRVERLQLISYLIDAHCLEFYWLPKSLQQEKQIWLRAATYQFLAQAEFYVLEFFSENLKNLTGQDHD